MAALIKNPFTGFGLGLRSQHYPDFLQGPQPLNWLEIITDNYLGAGGRPLATLERLRADYPMAMHGVAMSIGASGVGPDPAYLAKVKALADRIDPLWVSDHLCWIGTGEHQLHDLYPLPYTEEAARHVIAQIGRAQDALGRRLVIENVSSYLRFRYDAAAEWQFLAHVAEQADCLLLVDVNNIQVSALNHGFDPLTYLRALPAHRVQQMHLAGHSFQGQQVIDTHDHPVSDAVFALYGAACELFGPVPTMIERDDHIPPLSELLEEMQRVRVVSAQHAQKGSPPTHPMPTEPWRWAICELETPDLQALQHSVGTAVFTRPSALSSADIHRHLASDAGVSTLDRIAVYHNAYRARLAEVLGDTFEKTRRYMGDDGFLPLARAHAVLHPPTSRHLSEWGDEFPRDLAERYPGNPELADLARLEHALRTRFDVADVPAMSFEAAVEDSASQWLHHKPTYHPSLVRVPVRSNAVAIWHAIHDDVDVPPPERFESPVLIAVWRQELSPHFRTLSAQEARAWELLLAGLSLAETADRLADEACLDDPSVFGKWLQSWWAEGLLRQQGAAQPSGY